MSEVPEAKKNTWVGEWIEIFDTTEDFFRVIEEEAVFRFDVRERDYYPITREAAAELANWILAVLKRRGSNVPKRS